MPTYHEGCICLSKEESGRFAWLSEHPDPEMIGRRDDFLAEIDRTLRATPEGNGFWVETIDG